MQKILTLAISAAITLSACTGRKTTPTTETPPKDVAKPVANAAFFTRIAKPSEFSQVKINSKVDVQTGSYLPTADATIYIENGKKLCMNISAAFLNVARGIATPSGIKGYERISKTYIDSDFTYLNTLLNVNFVDYQTLQNLLVGKTFISVNADGFTLTQNAQGYTLTSGENQTFVVNGKNYRYKTVLNYTPTFDLSKINMQSPGSADSFEVAYSNWISVGNERFPKNVKIIIKGQKNSQILIENTKFETVKMETPYSVPNNYTKKEF